MKKKTTVAHLTHFPRKMRILLMFSRIPLKQNGEVSIFRTQKFFNGVATESYCFLIPCLH